MRFPRSSLWLLPVSGVIVAAAVAEAVRVSWAMALTFLIGVLLLGWGLVLITNCKGLREAARYWHWPVVERFGRRLAGIVFVWVGGTITAACVISVFAFH